MLCRMSPARSRLPLALAGALLISLVLGSSAINLRRAATPTPAAEAAAEISPSRTASLAPAITATSAPSLTPSLTPTMVDTLTPTPWPTPDANGPRREVKVPILMYHHVGPLPDRPDQIRIGLTILPDHFEEQLRFLKERGYTSVDLYQMQYALALGWPLPARPVVFTFDDAYADAYQFAFPLMQKYGFTGTLFVPTQFLDEQRADYMSWQQALEMFHAGWRLEPHTKTHEQLDQRGRDFQVYQIYGSMETLRYHLGYQPRFFAYPSGKYNDSAIQVLKEVGYWGAVTTDTSQYHRLANAYTWGRVRVSGAETLQDLANRLGETYP